MKFSLNFAAKLKIVCKTLAVQTLIFTGILFLMWGSQALYSTIDRVSFPERFAVEENAANLPENEKGKILLNSITHQLQYELNSTFGWTYNDILFNKYVLDNRAYRQYGVYHTTKVLMDLYAMNIAKLGSSDRESQFLYEARLNNFSIDPRSFWFPSAESRYEKGLEKCEQYKASLDNGKGVYNARTDDIYASFDTVIGENMLGYALGLMQNSQDLPFYTLDNRIYEVQGMTLVIRDFIATMYELYPEIRNKNNEDNMMAALDYLDKICTYNPLYITSTINSGELVISHLIFAKNRLQDIRDSLRI